MSRVRDKETARLLHLKDPELLKAIVDEEEGGDAASGSASSGIGLGNLQDKVRMKRRRAQGR